MKKLILVRHAKSDWDNFLDDHDRPLAERGVKRAISNAGIAKNKIPFEIEFWCSSTAKRAKNTAEIFAETFGKTEKLNFSDSLYTFSGRGLMDFITQISDEHSSAILFGHNNAMWEVANFLGGNKITEFKTANVVFLKFEENNWSKIENGKLIFHLHKKDENAE